MVADGEKAEWDFGEEKGYSIEIEGRDVSGVGEVFRVEGFPRIFGCLCGHAEGIYQSDLSSGIYREMLRHSAVLLRS
jgi:hypothetical protein